MIPILRKNLSYLFTDNASHLSISCFRSLRLFSTSKEGELDTSPAIFDLLRHKYQFSPQVASKAASASNRVKDPQKFDSVLSFLKENGFSNVQLEKMVKYRPRYLSSSIDNTIKPKIRVLQDFGFCSDDIARIMSSLPVMLGLNFNTRVIPALSILKGLLGTNDAVTKLLRRSEWFLSTDLDGTLIPNVDFLRSCGVPMERIIKFLYLYPRCFLLKPEIIRKCVEKAVDLGVNTSSNLFIHALQAVCSMPGNAWELKLQAFRNCGFSEGDIITMFGKAPLMFNRSAKTINGVKNVILATGKYDMSCIVNFPTSFGYSIEKRYIPRFHILEMLERKNLIKRWPMLSTVLVKPDEKFFKCFVEPYFGEVGEAFAAKRSARANISLKNRN